MGGFADYSGSLVLEMPIAEAAFVAVQRHPAPRVRLSSLGQGGRARPRIVPPLEELCTEALTWAGARRYLGRDRAAGGQATSSERCGARRGPRSAAQLRARHARRVPRTGGQGRELVGRPRGGDFAALRALSGMSLDPVAAALLPAHRESRRRRAVRSHGSDDRELRRRREAASALCQPATLEGCVSIPAGLGLWGIDSGLRHQVSGADYGSVRVAAFMGYRMIAARLFGVDQWRRAACTSPTSVRGYLANVARRALRTDLRELPERMSGRIFSPLRHHGRVTASGRIDLSRARGDLAPALRASSGQRVPEILRVGEAAPANATRLGELMVAAHESYPARGLGSTGTDRIVALVAAAWRDPGCTGRRLPAAAAAARWSCSGPRGGGRRARVARGTRARRATSRTCFPARPPGAAAFGAAGALPRVALEDDRLLDEG